MIDDKIKAWLKSCPGPIIAPTHDAVLRSAWAACGVACSVEDFRKLLFNRGFSPVHDARRNRWILALPEQVNNAPIVRHANVGDRRDGQR